MMPAMLSRWDLKVKKYAFRPRMDAQSFSWHFRGTPCLKSKLRRNDIFMDIDKFSSKVSSMESIILTLTYFFVVPNVKVHSPSPSSPLRATFNMCTTTTRSTLSFILAFSVYLVGFCSTKCAEDGGPGSHVFHCGGLLPCLQLDDLFENSE
ncbi:hypothetical protein ACTXT7_007438 [Hymenolepis weldensis]